MIVSGGIHIFYNKTENKIKKFDKTFILTVLLGRLAFQMEYIVTVLLTKLGGDILLS